MAANGAPIFAGTHATLVQTTVAGVEVTLIMTAVNVAATYLDRLRRRVRPGSGLPGLQRRARGQGQVIGLVLA
jgi:hypothetical protein